MNGNKNEKSFLTFKEFFDTYTQGEDIQDDEYAAIQKEYWREYHKRYQKKWNKQVKRINVRLSLRDYDLLIKEMEKHGEKKVGTYLSLIVKDHIGTRRLSKYQGTLEDISLSIRKSSNDINQIVQKIHTEIKYRRSGGVVEEKTLYLVVMGKYEDLVKQVTELEKLLAEITKAPTLFETLLEMYDGNEGVTEYALAIIDQLKSE